MRRHQRKKNPAFSRHWINSAVLIFGAVFLQFFLSACSSTVEKTENNVPKFVPVSETSPVNPANSASNTNKALTNSPQETVEPAKFSHNNQYHSQIDCLICHRRDNNSARISFPGKPGHSPCIGCHSQQFADNKSPICIICHTDTETGAMKPFPPLRSFGVRFDHARHLRSADCATCHKPSSGGVAKSIPAGFGTHALCFQCHSSQSSYKMSSCSTCHQPGRKGGATPEWAKAYNVNFSHARHKLSCATCHQVRAGASRGDQITAPLAAMHLAPKNRQTCASCHNNKRAFGGDDFADCKRCHSANNFSFPRLK